jgi:hypothetical protein
VVWVIAVSLWWDDHTLSGTSQGNHTGWTARMGSNDRICQAGPLTAPAD